MGSQWQPVQDTHLKPRRTAKAWLAARVDAVSHSPRFTPIEAVFRNREDNRVATGWDLCADEEDPPVLLSIASRIQS